MLNLPTIVIDLIEPFAPCFYGLTTWMQAQTWLIGAMLTSGKRVVTEARRGMGLSQRRDCAHSHPVLKRAVGSPWDLAPLWLKLLVKPFRQAGNGLVLGIDPTIERRWGRKIAARGL
jgi:hypothetical protein